MQDYAIRTARIHPAFISVTGLKCSYGKVLSPLTDIPVGKTEISVTELARPLTWTHPKFYNNFIPLLLWPTALAWLLAAPWNRVLARRLTWYLTSDATVKRFPWRHPCVLRCIIDHGQRPIAARVIFITLMGVMDSWHVITRVRVGEKHFTWYFVIWNVFNSDFSRSEIACFSKRWKA